MKHYHEYLTGEELRIMVHRTHEQLIKHLGENHSSEMVNLFDYFSKIIFDTSVNVLFGETFARSQIDLYASFCRFSSVLDKLIIDFPFRSILMSSSLRQREEYIERFMYLKSNDDMSAFVKARIEMTTHLGDGQIFNERDKAGYHGLLLWVAVVNMMPHTCWSLIDLLLHPDSLKAVRNELQTKVTYEFLNEKETLNELRILESCINETLRRTAASVIQRQATQDINFICTDGVEMAVRKNDIVIYPPFLNHLNPQVCNFFFVFLNQNRLIKIVFIDLRTSI